MAENNPSDETSGRFSEVPPETHTQVKSGLRIIARMSKDSQVKLADCVRRSIGLKRPSFEVYADILSLSLEETVEVMSAAMVTMVFLSENTISAEEFGQQVVDDEFIDARDQETIASFAQTLLDQDIRLREELEKTHVSTLLIPAFVSFDAVIDVRLGFEEGHIRGTAPVAVMRLNTDDSGTDKEALFQITLESIEAVIEQLHRVKRQLQAAIEWTQQQSSHQEGG